MLDIASGTATAARDLAAHAHLDACSFCRELVAEAARYVHRDARARSGATFAGGEGQEGAAEPSVLAAGDRVERYAIDRAIGIGAMGIVYAAFDSALERHVALKLLRTYGMWSEGELERRKARLRREAQAMAKLSHPNVVTVYDVGSFRGEVFLAMELMTGRTLGQWLTDGPRTLEQVLDVFLAAGRGLAAAHRTGLVHRDFKPENVIVGADGQIKVTDFGLARSAGVPARQGPVVEASDRSGPALLSTLRPSDAVPDGLTRTGTRLGTPAYMSPEQFAGREANAASDQFSYCVALHEAIYGVRPFDGRTERELADAVSQGRIRAVDDAVKRAVPGVLSPIVRRGLRSAPHERYPSMDALLSDLEAARGRVGSRRPRTLPALAAGAAIVASGLAVFVARSAVRDAGTPVAPSAERREASEETSSHATTAAAPEAAPPSSVVTIAPAAADEKATSRHPTKTGSRPASTPSRVPAGATSGEPMPLPGTRALSGAKPHTVPDDAELKPFDTPRASP